MSKDSYNIDDILSEVKKRREENEKEIIEKAKQDEAPTDESIAEEPVTPEDNGEEEQKEDFIVIDNDEEENTEASENEDIIIIEKEEEAEEEAPTETKEEIPEAPAVKNDKQAKKDKKKKDKKKKSKTRKILKGIIIALVVLIVGAGVFAFAFFNGMLNDLLDNNDNKPLTSESRWEGMDGNEESFVPIYETEATELSSLQDMIKTWYYNGTPVSKSKVLNVLLVGEDTRGSEILDEGTRADSAIICSINAETNEITLTSILRDAYAYFESTPQDGTTGQFGKINGAMSIGDIGAYINCVENLYKIDIDNYVIVNFSSFEAIVDSLGGVELTVTSREINEINSHPKRYGNVTIEQTFEGTEGKMKLNGKQALAYCRIRKLDSDNMRADRQKTCLLQLFNQAKKASPTQLIKIVKELIPYVSTGFNKQEILKIAKYALTENWLSYKTTMHSVPEHNLKGGTYYGAWCWKCDFPQDAYNLQMRIYGKSNITLAHLRVDTAKCPEKGFYSEGADRVWATVTNDHYGEVTTIAPPTTEDNQDTTTSN